jgi:hypothetical protein
MPNPAFGGTKQIRNPNVQIERAPLTLPSPPEGVKKLIWFLFRSFRRKPESSVFKALEISWTPVFTGVTA